MHGYCSSREATPGTPRSNGDELTIGKFNDRCDFSGGVGCHNYLGHTPILLFVGFVVGICLHALYIGNDIFGPGNLFEFLDNLRSDGIVAHLFALLFAGP